MTKHTVISAGPVNAGEAFANARLIVAAPELLAALDMMERHFSRYDDTHNNLVLEQARAAIAKATGGEG